MFSIRTFLCNLGAVLAEGSPLFPAIAIPRGERDRAILFGSRYTRV